MNNLNSKNGILSRPKIILSGFKWKCQNIYKLFHSYFSIRQDICSIFNRSVNHSTQHTLGVIRSVHTTYSGWHPVSPHSCCCWTRNRLSDFRTQEVLWNHHYRCFISKSPVNRHAIVFSEFFPGCLNCILNAITRVSTQFFLLCSFCALFHCLNKFFPVFFIHRIINGWLVCCILFCPYP